MSVVFLQHQLNCLVFLFGWQRLSHPFFTSLFSFLVPQSQFLLLENQTNITKCFFQFLHDQARINLKFLSCTVGISLSSCRFNIFLITSLFLYMVSFFYMVLFVPCPPQSDGVLLFKLLSIGHSISRSLQYCLF